MTFVFQRGDGEREVLPLEGYGGKVRVAWGEPGLRAATWTIVSQPNGEVYVMERTTGAYLKASLHKSGVWRYAWNAGSEEKNSRIKALIDSAGDRVIDRWDRPRPLRGDTLTIGYTIFTTGEDIVPTADDPARLQNVVWLPPPEVGEVGILQVTFVKPNAQQLVLRRTVPVAGVAMRTGEALLLVAARRRLTLEEKASLRVHRELLARARPQVLAAMPNTSNPRVLMPASDQNGARFVLDLAL